MLTRAFINSFQPPVVTHSWGTFEAGGYPQTPSKGVLPLCKPQWLNDLCLPRYRLYKRPRHTLLNRIAGLVLSGIGAYDFTVNFYLLDAYIEAISSSIYSRLSNVLSINSARAGCICMPSLILCAFPPVAMALMTSWISSGA